MLSTRSDIEMKLLCHLDVEFRFVQSVFSVVVVAFARAAGARLHF